MKILMVHKFYFEDGGSDIAFFRTIELLEKNNHMVVPFAMQHSKNIPTSYDRYFVSYLDFSLKNSTNFGDKVRSIGRMFYSFEAKRKIEKLVEATQPDIAHIHNIYHQISPSIFQSLKKRKIPIVMTLHDYKLACPQKLFFRGDGKLCDSCKGKYSLKPVFHKCVKNSYGASFLCSLELLFHRWLKIYNLVDLFISPSQYYADKLVEYKIISPSKVVVLPNFTEIPVTSENGSGDYLLYTGRLSPEKGLFILLSAMALVNKKIPLYLAGEGELQEKIKKFLKKHNLKNVKLLGFVKQNDLRELLDNCKALILPSLSPESCSMSILEAFAGGKPVIAARIGGIPEQVEEGVDGLLFEPGNEKDLRGKIEHLLINPALAIEMGRRAREKVEEKYNPEGYYRKLMEIYQEVAQ